MATSSIKNNYGIRTVTVTGTTNSSGSIVIPTLTSSDVVIGVRLYSPSSSCTYCIGEAGGVVYLHLMDEAGNPAPGTSINFDVTLYNA